MLIWKGSGIVLVVVVFLIAWIVGFWFPDHRLGNLNMTGWIAFYSAIVALLHGLAVLPRKDENGQKTGRLMDHSLFYIPMIFWAPILGGISIYCLLIAGGKNVADPVAGKGDTAAVPMRTVHFLNSSEDTVMLMVSSSSGYYKEEKIKPLTYVEEQLAKGSYVFAASSMDDSLLYYLPGPGLANSPARSVKAKTKDGKEYFELKIDGGTPDPNDYDEAWVILDEERRLFLVEVTPVCKKGLTREMVDGVDWAKQIAGVFDGRDIAEPLAGKDPGKGKFTVLSIGKKIPETLDSGERVFILFSAPPEREVTGEYIAGKVAKLCPAIPKENE